MTVASIQTSYGHDLEANIAKTEDFVREAAKRGAQVILPSELFQGIYFCTRQDPKWFETAYAGERASVRARTQKAGGEARRRHPDLVLREGRPALTTTASPLPTRTVKSSASIARATFPMARAIRRNTTSGRAIPASRPGRRSTAASASASAGTSGIRNVHARWFCRAPRSCSIRPRSDQSPMTLALDTHLQWQRVMQGHAVVERGADRRRQPHRPRGQRRYEAEILWPFLHRRSSRRTRAEVRRQTNEGVLVHTFDLDLIDSYRADWGFFRDRRTDLYAKSIV